MIKANLLIVPLVFLKHNAGFHNRAKACDSTSVPLCYELISILFAIKTVHKHRHRKF